MRKCLTKTFSQGLVLFAIVMLSVPSAFAADTTGPEAEKTDDYYELMKTIVDVFEKIDRNYVKDVDKEKLAKAAIQGMLETLDEYSSYIDPEEMAQFNQQVEQEFGGIGIQVHVDRQTNRLTVMTPLPGTPAYEAGMKAGDTIMEIEGESTEGFTLEQAVKLLKGKPGEAVTLGIRHAGEDDIKQVRVVRDIIHVTTVLGDRYNKDGAWNFMLDENEKIGYLRLTHFSRHSARELREALSQLKREGMQALVLDLRFNPGGLLSQATAIADLFVEEGRIVSTKGKNSPERVWNAKKSGTFSGFPMAVLVNRYSASASEILSACLQDHKRAVIVGDRTWGKGSVQNVDDVSGGGALKLTTASYHRPSGKNIHRHPGDKDSDEWGVSPDEGFDLKMSLQEIQDFLEYRRDRDVLDQEGPPKSDFEDKQLAKALEYVRGQLKGATAKGDEAKPSAAKKPAATGAAALDLRIRLPLKKVLAG